MEQRLTNMWRMTVNEKFIETALLSGLRIDGRNLHYYRKLTIKFGRESRAVDMESLCPYWEISLGSTEGRVSHNVLSCNA
ncbi:hypothetical protein SAY87_020648 [Trapa incisa]|uniref:Uncharacterized protein n=1 Tax=Trapa incisa TaxID=236973 RepID=A0AAN7PUH8_9MYRT|nr:hypothetical protein SAY87_020648 [Trapa incisa]